MERLFAENNQTTKFKQLQLLIFDLMPDVVYHRYTFIIYRYIFAKVVIISSILIPTYTLIYCIILYNITFMLVYYVLYLILDTANDMSYHTP